MDVLALSLSLSPLSFTICPLCCFSILLFRSMSCWMTRLCHWQRRCYIFICLSILLIATISYLLSILIFPSLITLVLRLSHFRICKISRRWWKLTNYHGSLSHQTRYIKCLLFFMSRTTTLFILHMSLTPMGAIFYLLLTGIAGGISWNTFLSLSILCAGCALGFNWYSCGANL